MKKKTATMILYEKHFPKAAGKQALYKCEPPIDGHKYVVASSVVAMFSGPETYLFPATAKGEIKEWVELSPSQRGTLSAKKVFKDAGYEVIEG